MFLKKLYGFSMNREFTTEDILQSIKETVPLAVTASEKITHLRQWAHKRAPLVVKKRKGSQPPKALHWYYSDISS
jgi:hypothetical protein